MFGRLSATNFRNISLLSRVWSGPSGVLAGKQAEQKMVAILRDKFPKARLIEVTDVSGGCGAMFEVNVVAPEFKGLNTVKQHRIINEALKEEIKDMHGTIVFNKVREIIPGLTSSITPEVLSKITEESDAQPFLRWFCANITRNNVLTEEEVTIKKSLEKKQGLLSGDELDSALEEATRDCPELLQILSLDFNPDCSYSAFEKEKEIYDDDLAYLKMLEESTERLRKLEDKLSEEIECEETVVQKIVIETEESYKDCVDVLRDLDLEQKELYRDVENLANVYADAAERKGPPILWIQMPLELSRSQAELYYNYLSNYIKRQFGDNNRDDQMTHSGYESYMMDESRDRRKEEMLHELTSCNGNLIISMLEETTAKVAEDAAKAMLEYLVELYNNGNVKTPQNQTQVELEIVELRGKRDFLEEDLRLLREVQLEVAITQSVELEILQVLVNDARQRVQRRERRLEKMLQVQALTQESGHANIYLLCMLMDLQLRRLIQVIEVVADARYYLVTEYTLSSTRLDAMQRLQTEYNNLMSDSPTEWNAFNKIFIPMVLENEDDKKSLAVSMKRYDLLTSDNDRNEEKLFGEDLNSIIDSVNPLENKVNAIYALEANDGSTVSLKQTPYKLKRRLENTEASVEQVQEEVAKIRSRLKEKMRNIEGAMAGLEREKAILWQRFLADPDTLMEKYNQAKKRADRKHFTDNL